MGNQTDCQLEEATQEEVDAAIAAVERDRAGDRVVGGVPSRLASRIQREPRWHLAPTEFCRARRRLSRRWPPEWGESRCWTRL